MAYLIGVDAGGTKTKAVAYDLMGNELSTETMGFGNLLVDEKSAVENIQMAITRCIAPLEDKRCQYIVVGSAGIEAAPKEYLTQVLEKFNVPFLLINDARLAHAAVLKGKDGILTIAGTGSVSLGIYRGEVLISGGWGHLLGDEGSGYFIAMLGIKRLIADFEKGKIRSRIGNTLADTYGLETPTALKSFVYGSSKGEIAKLTNSIVTLARAGDVEAGVILKQAGEYLAENVRTLMSRLKFEQTQRVSVGVSGGVLTGIYEVYEAFKRSLQNERVEIISEKEICPTRGGYYLGLDLMNK